MTLRTSVRAPLLVAVGVLLVTVAVTGCSSDDDGSPRSSTTAVSTTVATPSTVSDADFDSQATTAELMIRNAGTDPCAVVKAFSPASSLPTPINPTQTERGVRVVAGLFQAAAESAPPEAAGDAQVLSKAATDLVAEGEAAGWAPAWVIGIPKAISNPAVTQAFTNYQSAVSKTCNPTTTAPAGG